MQSRNDGPFNPFNHARLDVESVLDTLGTQVGMAHHMASQKDSFDHVGIVDVGVEDEDQTPVVDDDCFGFGCSFHDVAPSRSRWHFRLHCQACTPVMCFLFVALACTSRYSYGSFCFGFKAIVVTSQGDGVLGCSKSSHKRITHLFEPTPQLE